MAEESKEQLIKYLEKEGWIPWGPSHYKRKVGRRWVSQTQDIHGIFDIVAFKRDQSVMFVQGTTAANIRNRQKKVEEFHEKNDFYTPHARFFVVAIQCWLGGKSGKYMTRYFEYIRLPEKGSSLIYTTSPMTIINNRNYVWLEMTEEEFLGEKSKSGYWEKYYKMFTKKKLEEQQ